MVCGVIARLVNKMPLCASPYFPTQPHFHCELVAATLDLVHDVCLVAYQGARHSKMEKADILEMTVKHLRQMQRQHFTGELLGEIKDEDHVTKGSLKSIYV